MAVDNGNARKNLPGGEVGTAPVSKTVVGEVVFVLPVQVQGLLVEDVQFTFVDCEVDEFGAEEGEDTLESVFSTGAGASRLGESASGRIERSSERLAISC